MGDSILRSSEQTWLGFSKSLINIFQTQFSRQSDIYATLTKSLTDQMMNPHGFSQATLAALRGGMTDNIATQFNSARQNVQNTEASRGTFGSDVKSGVDSQIAGQIAGQQAGATASGLDEIQRADAQQKQDNYWRSVQGLDSVARGQDPTAFSGQATSAASETGKLGTAYFGTDQSGFSDQLGGAFANSLGKGLGNLAGGALSKGLGIPSLGGGGGN